MKVQLREVAFARSGDKGDTANVGLITYTEEAYEALARAVTEERVEIPNLRALNFLLHGSLDGGGTRSLMLDAQGKTFSTALLRMEVELREEIVEGARERMREERRRWREEGDGE